jgi:hypothetical protein
MRVYYQQERNIILKHLQGCFFYKYALFCVITAGLDEMCLLDKLLEHNIIQDVFFAMLNSDDILALEEEPNKEQVFKFKLGVNSGLLILSL